MSNELSQESLSNILIRNYHNIIDMLKRYHSLSDYEKKIIILSMCFEARVSIPYEYLTNIVSDEVSSVLKTICEEHHIKKTFICFYYNDSVPKLSVKEFGIHMFVVIPTKANYLIKVIDDINLDELLLALKNNAFYNNIEDVSENKNLELYKACENTIEGIPLILKK